MSDWRIKRFKLFNREFYFVLDWPITKKNLKDGGFTFLKLQWYYYYFLICILGLTLVIYKDKQFQGGSIDENEIIIN